MTICLRGGASIPALRGMVRVLWLRAVAGGLCGFGLAGCQAPQPPTGPTAAVVRLESRERFLESALTVLREHDLEPQRVDWDLGLAVTRPATSAQWFEIWRADAPGFYQMAESSLHTIQRVVRLRMEPAGGNGAAAALAASTQPLVGAQRPTSAPSEGDYIVTVEVDKYRYSMPERQVTAPSAALGLYSNRLPTEAGQRASREQQREWIPVGRDPLLERRLLERFVRADPGAALQEFIQPPAAAGGGAGGAAGAGRP